MPVLNLVNAGLKMGAQGSAYEARHSASILNQWELEHQAKLDEANAVDALRQGAQDAGRIRMKASDLVGQQQMAYAYSGVDPTVGTAATAAAGTRLWAELDVATAKNNALRKAMGYKEAARKSRAQVLALEKADEADLTGTALGWAGTLMDSFASGMAGGMMGGMG